MKETGNWCTSSISSVETYEISDRKLHTSDPDSSECKGHRAFVSSRSSAPGSWSTGWCTRCARKRCKRTDIPIPPPGKFRRVSSWWRNRGFSSRRNICRRASRHSPSYALPPALPRCPQIVPTGHKNEVLKSMQHSEIGPPIVQVTTGDKNGTLKSMQRSRIGLSTWTYRRHEKGLQINDTQSNRTIKLNLQDTRMTSSKINATVK